MDYRDLTDVSRRRSVEPAGGFFLAEGAWVVERALAAGYPLRSVLVEERWLSTVGPLLVAGAPVYVGAGEVLDAVTGYHVHRGALASFSRLPLPSPERLLADARRVVVLEAVNNPTNIGAVFRAAAGLGMDAVLLDDRCADPLYRRSVRVSMGAALQVSYARVTTSAAAVAALRAAGFRVLGLSPRPEATSIRDLRPDPGARLAVMLGAEGPGLDAPTLADVDELVRIPMHAGVNSLNVSAAAAVACYVLGTG